MRGRKRRGSLFFMISALAAGAVTLFVFTAMSFVVVTGIPYLPEAVRSEEVRFALGLSLKTSVISTLICLAVGIPAAYALTRKSFRFGKIRPLRGPGRIL